MMFRVPDPSVIPAKAGIPLPPPVRHEGSGNPAFAGMTEGRTTTK
jgi:hypothetical protein